MAEIAYGFVRRRRQDLRAASVAVERINALEPILGVHLPVDPDLAATPLRAISEGCLLLCRGSHIGGQFQTLGLQIFCQITPVASRRKTRLQAGLNQPAAFPITCTGDTFKKRCLGKSIGCA